MRPHCVPWANGDMMTSSNGNISALLALCAGNSPVMNSPHKGLWRGALMFSLICPLLNGWINNREAGDLRRHGVQNYVILMDLQSSHPTSTPQPITVESEENCTHTTDPDYVTLAPTADPDCSRSCWLLTSGPICEKYISILLFIEQIPMSVCIDTVHSLHKVADINISDVKIS